MSDWFAGPPVPQLARWAILNLSIPPLVCCIRPRFRLLERKNTSSLLASRTAPQRTRLPFSALFTFPLPAVPAALPPETAALLPFPDCWVLRPSCSHRYRPNPGTRHRSRRQQPRHVYEWNWIGSQLEYNHRAARSTGFESTGSLGTSLSEQRAFPQEVTGIHSASFTHSAASQVSRCDCVESGRLVRRTDIITASGFYLVPVVVCLDTSDINQLFADADAVHAPLEKKQQPPKQQIAKTAKPLA